MQMKAVLFALAFAVGSGFAPATAATKSKAAPVPKRLDRATEFLKGVKVTKLDVEKTVVSELLGKTTTSKGLITLGSGKFRWETTEPEKSLIVFDGKTLWTLQTPSPELGGPAQVTKSTLNGKARDQILVKILGGGKMSSKFEIRRSESGDDGFVVQLAPLKPDPTVRDFSVVLGGKPERLREIRYGDEVGNQTKIRILDSSTVKKPAKDLFKFQAPKGAEVTEL